MAYNFCTITTLSHLYKTWVWAESLNNINHNVILHILIIDSDKLDMPVPENVNNVFLYNLHNLNNNLADKIIDKYQSKKDKLRWSLKSVFLKYLIENINCDKVIYTDNDIAFYNDFSFLFDELTQHSILLTPHNYLRNPDRNQNWLEANFKAGLYNAGFIGVNKNAIDLLEWWAKCCFYRCEKNTVRGLFDDQKYLDLVPVIQPDTLVLRHKGCNVAEWNIENCKRTSVDGSIVIDDIWQIVFIHFNKTTVQSFLGGKDELLNPYFEQYVDKLKKYRPQLNINNEGYTMNLVDTIKFYMWKLLNHLNNS
jgi:hypothetical protein